MYATGFKPSIEYGIAIHGASPNEVRRMGGLACRMLGPVSKGTSRSAKLLYHRHPLVGAETACTRQFCAELWRASAGRVEALPIGGSDSMHAVWEIARKYNGGWKEVEGPAHVMELELERAGAVMLPHFELRIGDAEISVLKHAPTWSCGI